MKKNDKGLGKGLDALIKPSYYEEQNNEIVYININKIKPNPMQPRKNYSQEKITELASSIQEQGVLQPILVRQNSDKEYEIIAGERRWRASLEAGLTTVPALIKEFQDQEVLAIALIENLQREDLNPMEQAFALQKLQDELGVSQDQLATKIGKSRPQLTNLLRLIKLPQKVQDLIESSEITSGHARALLSIKDEELMIKICDKIIKKELSVRQTEELVKNYTTQENKVRGNNKAHKDEYSQHLENKIKEKLPISNKLKLKGNEQKGQITIKYENEQELEELLNFMGVGKEDI